MTALPDPGRSRVVLIGASTYRHLEDLPAVHNNLTGFRDVLINPALGRLHADKCAVLEEPPNGLGVYQALRAAAMAAEDTLLVYFSGHGRTGDRNELYLCLPDTDPDVLSFTALAYNDLRKAVAESRALKKVVILDCCFSGRALADLAGNEETIVGQVSIEGSYILTATPPNAVALAPPGERYTAFTGALLALLRAGIPGGSELLTFAEIYPRLKQALTSRQHPQPGQQGSDTITGLALTRNVAFTQPAPQPPTGPEPRPSRRSPADVVRERLPYLRSMRSFKIVHSGSANNSKIVEKLAERHHPEASEELLAIWRLGVDLPFAFGSTDGIAFTTSKISIRTYSRSFEIPYSRFEEFRFKRGSLPIMAPGTTPTFWIEIEGTGLNWRSGSFTNPGRVNECDQIVQLLKDIQQAASN